MKTCKPPKLGTVGLFGHEGQLHPVAIPGTAPPSCDPNKETTMKTTKTTLGQKIVMAALALASLLATSVVLHLMFPV